MANADELVTYLVLAPEFGGTRFGPFEQLEVRLGSNPDRCHIVLPENLGVMGEHARLIRQGPQNLILAPAERTATVFLWKSGSRRPNQLNTPTAVRPGDAFALVTPDGPRFIIELGELPPEVKEQREKQKRRSGTGRGRLSAQSMGTEVKRQAWTRVLVMGPMQIVQRGITFVRSGAIYQPRNIIMGMLIMSGWIFGGAASCSGRSKSRKLSTTVTKYEDCQADRDLAMRIGDDVEGAKFEEMAARITRSVSLGSALEQDAALRTAVKERAKIIQSQRKDFEWLYQPKDRQAQVFAEWRERLADEDDLDRDTSRLLIWVAANPKRGRSDFDLVSDSESTDVCARGSARLTWRQAVHLGISAQPDAYYRGQASSLESTGDREALLLGTMATIGMQLPETTIETDLDPIRQGGEYCVYIKGDDDRTRDRRVVKELTRQLGPSASFLPPTETTFSAVARIAKYWSADLVTANYAGDKAPRPDFADMDTAVSAILDAQEGRGAWVMTRTADTIARSVVLPCLALLKGKAEDVKNILGEDMVPGTMDCLALDWKLRNDT